MARMCWQPGDTVGGPQKAYFTPAGVRTEPVKMARGGTVLFREVQEPGGPPVDSGTLYRKHELVLTVTVPEKKLPTLGRKKVR